MYKSIEALKDGYIYMTAVCSCCIGAKRWEEKIETDSFDSCCLLFKSTVSYSICKRKRKKTADNYLLQGDHICEAESTQTISTELAVPYLWAQMWSMWLYLLDRFSWQCRRVQKNLSVRGEDSNKLTWHTYVCNSCCICTNLWNGDDRARLTWQLSVPVS